MDEGLTVTNDIVLGVDEQTALYVSNCKWKHIGTCIYNLHI